MRVAMSTVLLGLQGWGLQRLDGLAQLRGKSSVAPHLATGLRGEREALLHLRQLGYVVVARRWKSVRLRGDVDLIAWAGACLCFVEVKTRSGRNPMEPAEAAVDADKQEMLRKMGRAYLKGFARELRNGVQVRFDVVSVYLLEGAVEFEVKKGAFGWE
jgi:putative endonuclease